MSSPELSKWAGRGSSAQRGYGWAWQQTRNQVMVRDHGLCQPCKQAGRVSLAGAVDHIKPKARGGTDDPANLRAICDPCHQAKTQADAQGREWDGIRPQRIGADGWPID